MYNTKLNIVLKTALLSGLSEMVYLLYLSTASFNGRRSTSIFITKSSSIACNVSAFANISEDIVSIDTSIKTLSTSSLSDLTMLLSFIISSTTPDKFSSLRVCNIVFMELRISSELQVYFFL